MALPVLRSRTQLYINNAWTTDISGYVLMDDSSAITVTRGRQDEASQVQPSTCALTLNNKDGRFSPRNPTGPYYGLIGRNTPIRVQSLTGAATSLLVPGGSTNSKATTPDNAALDIVGDVDLRAEFTLDSFAATASILSKGTRLTDLAYELLVGFTAGVPHLTFRFSTTGTDEQFLDHPIPELRPGVPIAVRAWLDVDTGSGQHEFAFYTSDSGTIAGPWTLHGGPTFVSGAVSIASTAGNVSVGQNPAGNDKFIGNIRAIRVLNSIGGTQVANPDFNAQPAGTTSFTDAAGRTWTVGSAASIGTEPATRFTGEVSAWPQTWNDTGTDVWTPLTAAGILRRLGQGQPAKQTGAKTFVTSKHFDQCWPGDTALSISSAHTKLILNNCAQQVHYGQGVMGDGLPNGMLIDTTNTVTGNIYPQSGYISGTIGASGGGTFEAAGFAFKADSLGSFAFYVNAYGGAVPGYVILFDAGVNRAATIYRITFDPDLGYQITSIAATPTAQAFFTDGLIHSALWTITDTGGSLTHALYIDGISLASAADAGGPSDLQGMSNFQLTYDPTTVSGGSSVAMSFITFWSDQFGDQTLPDPVDWTRAINGYIGELAGRRIQRLCSENAIPFTAVGDLDATIPMGPQGSADLITLLQDAAGADLGILHEPRDALGLTYRTRASLYNQAAQVTLDYSAATLGTAPDVTDDDQGVNNDVTVSRPGGGSATDTLTTGPLSTQAPPNGIGTYPTSVTVNVVTDGLLPDQASWRLLLGTVDEARWPSLNLTLMNPALAATSLLAQVIGLDLGDLLTVTHLPAWLPPDDVLLLTQGYTETFNDYRGWDLAVNLTPGSPYSVAVYATSTSVGNSHYDAENSTVGTGFNSSATSLSIASAANTQLWTTDSNAFPFDIRIGGERITVTNITGSSSPQTFTVTRSVNGVVKAHTAGEQVRLWTTPRYAL